MSCQSGDNLTWCMLYWHHRSKINSAGKMSSCRNGCNFWWKVFQALNAPWPLQSQSFVQGIKILKVTCTKTLFQIENFHKTSLVVFYTASKDNDKIFTLIMIFAFSFYQMLFNVLLFYRSVLNFLPYHWQIEKIEILNMATLNVFGKHIA